MKRLLSLSATTIALALPGSANAINGRFMGGGTISNYSVACVNAGFTTNSDYYTVRYQPRNVGNNPDHDLLSFFINYSAFSVLLNGASFGPSWTAVQHAFLGRGIGYSNESDPIHAEVRITSIWPAVIDDTTTQAVRIRGQIRHFAHTPWCRVDFDVIVQQ